MNPTTIYLHVKHVIDRVDPRVFGGFLEHMWRGVYDGIYNPGSAHADEDGLRTDVLDALRGLGLTNVRYPGGNFVSNYHWQDGVGPREQRPTVRELAWGATEPNAFGTDEFIALARKMDWEPMMTANLGTGSPEEACDWLEYCNGPGGTKFADMRIANGRAEPYGIRLWCLGNEMDGDWQIGQWPAREYGIRARQAAKMMRDYDKSVEFIVCGACQKGPDWDLEVLDHLGEFADYLSLHQYVADRNRDVQNFMAVTNGTDDMIERGKAACRLVQTKRNAKKRTRISFDEWNAWPKKRENDPDAIPGGYDLSEAIVVAGFLHCFLRHADVVKIANLAQIVNVIAPIVTKDDEMLLQSFYWPIAMFSRRREGLSLRAAVDGPGWESDEVRPTKYIDASAVLGDGVLHVFVTNRHVTEAADVTVDLSGAGVTAVVDAELFAGPDAHAMNTWQKPDKVKSEPFDGLTVQAGGVATKLPPLSFMAATLRVG